MDNEYYHNTGSRAILGTIIILIGGLYLLKTLDLINLDISSIIFSFPFILFVIGVILLINSSGKTLGLLLAIIGAIFLIPNLYPKIGISSDIIIPILIIAFGIHLIFKRRIRLGHSGHYQWKNADNNYIDDVAIFGGGRKTIFSDNFKGGNITAIFGGSEIDLTQCKLAEGDVILDIAIIFGGTTIMVPKEWNIRVTVTPIFGGFSNKVFRNPVTPIDTSRTLIIRGAAIFGGGEIKYY
ncbi:MAG: LiaF domain-containing protein [Ignavibacteriaceae bacterium]|jgi:predicted membrane protein